MPRQGSQAPGGPLKNLLRKVPPVVRTCLLVGMTLGFLMGLYFSFGVPRDEVRDSPVVHAEARSAVWIVCGTTLAGGVIGTLLGVAVEIAFAAKNEQASKKPWWKGKRSSKRRD